MAEITEPAEIPVTVVDQLSQVVQFAHVMLASALEAPEFILTAEQSAALSKAGLNVAAWYMPSFKPSGKTGAWIALAGTAGMIYGGAAWKFIARKQMERQGGLPAPQPQQPTAH